MNFKITIEQKVRDERSSALAKQATLRSLEQDIAKSEYELKEYLEQHLERMSTALSQRNNYQGVLTKEEKEAIDLVDSGRLQEILERMPGSDRESYQTAKLKIYAQAKQKVPGEGLAVCGYLDSREDNGSSKSLLLLTLPVLFSQRHSEGSLEESIYEHTINIGRRTIPFTRESDYLGYVQFEISVEKDKLDKTAQGLVLRLENDLSPELTNAHVKYGLVIIGNFLKQGSALPVSTETSVQSPAPEPFSEGHLKKLEEPAQTQEWYRSTFAVKLWQEKLSQFGLEIPYKNTRWILRNHGRVHPEIMKKEGESLFYSKAYIDEIVREKIILRGKGTEKKFYVAKRPANARHVVDVIGKRLTIAQAAHLLDVHRNTVRNYINKKRLKEDADGFITGSSLIELMQKNKKKGGKFKTLWID